MSFSEESREETIRRILSEVEKKLLKDFDVDPGSLDEMEHQTQRIGDEIKRIMDEEVSKRSDRKQELISLARQAVLCGCGCTATYLGLRSRHVVMLSGVHAFRRSYYHCKVCRKCFAPLDKWLGIGSGQISRRVQALIGRLCCYLPDRLVARELAELFQIGLAVRTIQRYSRQMGQRMAAERASEQISFAKKTLPPSLEQPSRLHATMDGVMIHVDGGWREAKLGCTYQTDAKGKAIKSRYGATLQNSALFGKRLRVLAHQSGADRCSDIAVVADGAEWIWQETAKYFPQSTQILDYFHLTQHLWQVAYLRFGETSTAAAEWMTQQQSYLMADQADKVIAAVEAWKPRKQDKCTVRRRMLAYLKTHKHRMRYSTFTDNGYHIGSGVAESACKNVVQIRMKRAGMRWSEMGAEAMLHLCSWYSSYASKDIKQYVTV